MWPTYKQTKKYTFAPLCDVNSEKEKKKLHLDPDREEH